MLVTQSDQTPSLPSFLHKLTGTKFQSIAHHFLTFTFSSPKTVTAKEQFVQHTTARQKALLMSDPKVMTLQQVAAVRGHQTLPQPMAGKSTISGVSTATEGHGNRFLFSPQVEKPKVDRVLPTAAEQPFPAPQFATDLWKGCGRFADTFSGKNKGAAHSSQAALSYTTGGGAHGIITPPV